MATFTRNWSDGVPIGTEQASDLDTFIQNVRGDISDRIKNMVYGFVAGENTLSQHFQYLQFYEQASISQPSAGYGRVYCKAVGGKCELFWQDEDGDEIQLTTGGTIGGPNINLLAGMDLLGSATSDITINTNKFTVAGATGNTLVAGTLDVTGIATVGDGSKMATSAAPGADAELSNKKYVDDTPHTNGIVQIVNVQSGSVVSCATNLPYDDTIPQITEGNEVMTLAITPKSVTNKLLIDVTVFCSTTAATVSMLATALFQDTTAGALAAGFVSESTGTDEARCIRFSHYMAAGTTSATTFKVRAGTEDETLTFNGMSGARKYGGVLASSITITEIKV